MPIRNEAIAKKYVKQITEGLEYLHNNHIIHMDLKCQNILHDGQGNLKISDLGLGQVLQKRRLMATTMHKGTQDQYSKAVYEGGTILYICPEVVEAEQKGKTPHIGKRADIW